MCVRGMHLCVEICVSMCMRLCLLLRPGPCMYACMHLRMQPCTYRACMDASVQECMRGRLSACMHAGTRGCTHGMQGCMHEHACLCAHTHTHRERARTHAVHARACIRQARAHEGTHACAPMCLRLFASHRSPSPRNPRTGTWVKDLSCFSSTLARFLASCRDYSFICCLVIFLVPSSSIVLA